MLTLNRFNELKAKSDLTMEEFLEELSLKAVFGEDFIEDSRGWSEMDGARYLLIHAENTELENALFFRNMHFLGERIESLLEQVSA